MTLPFLELDGVTTLRLDEVGALEAKIRLEREQANVSVPRPSRFFGAVGLENCVKKGHLEWPSRALIPDRSKQSTASADSKDLRKSSFGKWPEKSSTPLAGPDISTARDWRLLRNNGP